MTVAAKQKEQVRIQIPGLDLKYYKVVVQSLLGSTMIQHRISEKFRKQHRDRKMGKASEEREPCDPIKEFEDATYRTTDGDFAFPSTGFKAVTATAALDLHGEKKAVIYRSVFILGEYSRVISEEPLIREDVVRLLGTGRPPDLRYRPGFESWKAILYVELRYKSVSLERFLKLLLEGGFCVGLAEWRPEKGGVHGRFEIETCEEITRDLAYCESAKVSVPGKYFKRSELEALRKEAMENSASKKKTKKKEAHLKEVK